MSEPSRYRNNWNRTLSELCVTHGRLLFRLSYGILRDSHAAEDVCQQAFIAACRKPPATDHPGRLRAWLARVVMNESLQMLRRSRVERRFRQQASQRLPVNDAVPQEPGLREEIMTALARLPEPNGLIVLLRIMDGMSGNDVKDILGYSAAEVSRRLRLGMEQLRELLAQHDAGPGEERRYGS